MTKFKIGSIHKTPKGYIKILSYTAGKRLEDTRKQNIL